MKRLTKRDKLNNCHAAIQAMKTGQRPKPRARDRSIPTHPVVDCPDLPEQGAGGVQDLCYKWLVARRVLCNKHDCGEGPEHVQFGIRDSGDIHGYLPGGRGFELECKRGKGGRLSWGQQKRRDAVRAAGGIYEVVHGLPELEHYFRGLI